MNDITTRRPLEVVTDGNAGPYLMVPISQLDQVKSLLDEHAVSYWVDETAISLDGSDSSVG